MDAKVNTDEPMNKPPESLAGTTNETNRSATGQELPQPVDGFEADTPIINEQSSPAELVDWGLPKFVDLPLVLTTSFGLEGCALMDLCSKTIAKHQLPNLTVACIDTGFFFPETHQLQKKLIERYTNLDFVSWTTPVTVDQQKETYGDNLWKNNPNLCCNIRKVQPMKQHIVGYRVWLTALRRSQTDQRSDVDVLGWDWRYQVLKFCPLATWSRSDVWNYIQENQVPFNQLHLQNYPSISCYHCTKPVPESNPDQEVRDGRWAGKDKTECGLHYSI
jgi:phosphoadenosine phosphosulfate reductase